MKRKTKIYITIILVLLIAYGGVSIYTHGLEKAKIAYQEGYIEGIIYTSRTGNIVYIENDTLKEVEVDKICNNLIKQKGGLI